MNNKDLVNIKTDRLIIRSIKEGDWRPFQKIWDDQKKSEYAIYDNPKDLSDDVVRELIKKWVDHQSLEHIFLVVSLGPEIIGFINFNLNGERHEISYGFKKEYQGKGFAREAVCAAIAELSRHGIKKFFAGTGLKNIPSVKLLKAVGFKQTGIEKVSFYKDSEGNPIYFDGGIYELDMP